MKTLNKVTKKKLDSNLISFTFNYQTLKGKSKKNIEPLINLIKKFDIILLKHLLYHPDYLNKILNYFLKSKVT